MNKIKARSRNTILFKKKKQFKQTAHVQYAQIDDHGLVFIC